MKKYICLLFILFSVLPSMFAKGTDNEIVAYQMNSCILSIYNINNSKSLDSYYKEKDRLSMISREGYVKIEEVKEIREKIYATMQQLEITQEEREVLRQIQAIEKQGDKWKAISNGLNQVMVFVPGGGRSGNMQQAAFYALLTAARAAVDYNVSANQANIEEAKVLWKIREKDLGNIAFLNTTANEKIDEMFEKYGLKDEYELKNVKDFVRIISISDPIKRAQNLLKNSSSFKYLNEYNYYLGMSYVEQHNYQKAKPCFDEYIRVQQMAKIYRSDSDNMLGCIMLAKLAHEVSASNVQKKSWIAQALKNMNHNGATLIECAAAYAGMNDFESAFSLLKDGLNDDIVTDKEAIVMAITLWMDKLRDSKYSQEVYDSVNSMIASNVDNINFSTYLYFLIKSGNKKSMSDINNLLQIKPLDGNGDIDIFDDIQLIFNNSYALNKDDFSIFAEEFEDDELIVKERKIEYVKGFKKEKLQKEYEILKDYPDLLYIFFDYQKLGDQYFVKKSISEEVTKKMLKAPASYKDFANLEISDLGNEKSTNRKHLKSLIEFVQKYNQKHRGKDNAETRLILDGTLTKVHREKEAGYVDNFYQQSKILSSYSLNQCKDSSKVILKYKEDIRTGDNSKYEYLIPLSYAKNHIRIVLCGKEIEDVGIVYEIDGKTCKVESCILGDSIIYCNGLEISRVAAPVKEPTFFDNAIGKAKEVGGQIKDKVSGWFESTTEEEDNKPVAEEPVKETTRVNKEQEKDKPSTFEKVKTTASTTTQSAISAVKGWFTKNDEKSGNDQNVEEKSK